MINDTGPDHVASNVDEKSHKMTIRAHSGRMIPVFPESPPFDFFECCMLGRYFRQQAAWIEESRLVVHRHRRVNVYDLK
jgi:hypothetical protein